MRISFALKALLSISAIMTLCPLDLAASDARKPNDFELAYTAIALDTLSHELCAKISQNAKTKAPFNSPGTQVYGERSRCFLYVAVKSLNTYLCREVIEANAWILDGSYFSRENCERLVARGQPFNFSLSFDHALILKEMGYRDEDIEARFPEHTVEPAWFKFYLDAIRQNNGDFQRRLKRLPDFSS